MRVIFVVNFFLKIEIFGGHEVLELYFKCSKNSISSKISIFQQGIKIFGPKLSYLGF